MARRAAEREARLVGHELRRGVDGLATVAATATWWGLALTSWHLATMFPGCSSCGQGFPEQSYVRMAAALLPTAWSLLVALSAHAGHGHFFAKAEHLAREASFAAEDFEAQLRHFRPRVD